MPRQFIASPRTAGRPRAMASSLPCAASIRSHSSRAAPSPPRAAVRQCTRSRDPRRARSPARRPGRLRQHGQVGQVVAHEGDLVGRDAQRRAQRARRRRACLRRLVHVTPEFARAPFGDRAVARGDQGDLDADLAQQHQAQAVEHVEGLGFLAVAVEAQAAVGERAVDVEARQADLARARVRAVGGIGRRGGRRRSSVRRIVRPRARAAGREC